MAEPWRGQLHTFGEMAHSEGAMHRFRTVLVMHGLCPSQATFPAGRWAGPRVSENAARKAFRGLGY